MTWAKIDYSHATEGVIVAVEEHCPKVERRAGAIGWWDLRDPATRAARGWVEVVETPRPADTATVTYDGGAELVDGVPTRTWTAREWLPGELARSLRAVKAQAMRAVSVPQLAATVQALVDAMLVRNGEPPTE